MLFAWPDRHFLAGVLLFSSGSLGFAAEMLVPGARLTFPDLIARAVGAHPSVGARLAELGVTRLETEIAHRQYFPAPSAQITQDGGSTFTTLKLSQPLWAGGRIDAGHEGALARQAAAEHAVHDARQALALRMAVLWQGWLAAQGRAEAARRGLELLDFYTQSVKRRAQEGFAAEVDQELVGGRVAQAQGDLAAAAAQERTARAQLGQAVGLALRAEHLALPAEPNAGLVIQPGDLPALLRQALETAPSLRRQQREIEAARQIALQRSAQRWPSVNLVGQHQRGSSSGLPVNDSRLLVTLEYTPGAGLDSVYIHEAAQQRIAVLESGLEVRQREIVDAVTADFEEMLGLQRRQTAGARALEAHRTVLASFDRQFAASRKTWLEVLNAARELTQVEMANADIAAALIGTAWRLQIATQQLPDAAL